MPDFESNSETQKELPKENPDSNKKEDLIPPQYKGMNSQVAEELWDKKIYADPEKTKEESQRREAAMEQMRQQELDREKGKKESAREFYRHLPEDQKQKFPESQKESAQAITGHISGAKKLENLSPEENFVLTKIEQAYQAHKQESPDKPFHFELGKEIDRQVYDNLSYRLTIEDIKSKQAASDQKRVNEIRESLGIPSQNAPKEENLPPSPEKKNENEAALKELEKYLEERALKSKNPEAMRDLLRNIKEENDKTRIAETLVNEINHKKRQADYPVNPDYPEAYKYAAKDGSLGHKEENSWVYRGNFPTKEKPTATRGSLNISLSEDALREIDELIKNGVIDANYKIGEPGAGSEASERHDALTLYFLEKPSPEALKALSKIGQKYYRGDDLIGKKISDGFYMSEIGSVSDSHVKELIQKLEQKDPDLGKAIKRFLTSRGRKGERTAMSEAQYYSTKETLNLFGLDINYDKEKGFELLKI